MVRGEESRGDGASRGEMATSRGEPPEEIWAGLVNLDKCRVCDPCQAVAGKLGLPVRWCLMGEKLIEVDPVGLARRDAWC